MPMPKKSAAKKKLQGNPGKRKLEDAATNGPKADRVAPKFLTSDQAAIFLEFFDVLTARGPIYKKDVYALAMLAQEWDMYQRLMKYLAKNGYSYLKKTSMGAHETDRPEVRQMQAAGRNARRLMDSFGMTPTSGGKVEQAPPEEDDPLGDFLGGRK